MMAFVEAHNTPDTDLAGILQQLQLHVAVCITTLDIGCLKEAHKMLGALSEHLVVAVERTADEP